MTPEPTTPRTLPRKTWRAATLAAALLAGTAIGGFAATSSFAAVDATGQTPTTAAPAPVNPPDATAAPRTLPDFTGLVTQVKPAVVSITTKLKADAGDDQQQAGPMQLPFPFNQMVPQQRAHAVEARGSGFIINANGTIVTNNHVVKDATSVSVTLDGGQVLAAKVVGRDPRTDIAILKVDAGHPLPYIQLGNSRDVKPGEWVVAMGNPFGLGGSVTAGIVSAVSRDIGAGPYDQFIQVDAPINQGNSGGPLFTQDGKVIGMNTAILSPTGGSVGIGFAIPSDMIRTVSAEIQQSGHVTRGFVGVEAQTIAGATARALHLTDNSGALLAGVQPDSPAAKAGLQPGDVIQQVNDQKITNPRDLALDVANIKPGDQAHFSVLRDGRTQDVAVTVGQMPNEQVASNDTGEHSRQGQIGLALAPLSPELRNQLDVPDGTQGAVVRGVRPGSPAETAGLQPGDIIVGVGNRPVSDPSEAAHAMRAALNGKDHALALRVIRDGQPVFVGVTTDEGGDQDAG
ncbi:MAG: Do family serine endopeptidase [Acetobacteraceae bacterium]|nr:Do family serine endopeptidase [Acetobacteraceae bacterium]